VVIPNIIIIMKESISADESASLAKDLTGYTGTMVIQSPEKMDVVPVGSNIATSSSPKPKGANKSKVSYGRPN
jgi:hypothetical protein